MRKAAGGSQGEIGMERKPQVYTLVLLFAALVAVQGCAKLQARDLLNKGVQAYKGGQFDAAIEDFKRSKDLDPSLLNARLYLATAYSSQYIPGAPSDENVRMGQQAISESTDLFSQPTIIQPWSDGVQRRSPEARPASPYWVRMPFPSAFNAPRAWRRKSRRSRDRRAASSRGAKSREFRRETRVPNTRRPVRARPRRAAPTR